MKGIQDADGFTQRLDRRIGAGDVGDLVLEHHTPPFVAPGRRVRGHDDARPAGAVGDQQRFRLGLQQSNRPAHAKVGRHAGEDHAWTAVYLASG